MTCSPECRKQDQLQLVQDWRTRNTAHTRQYSKDNFTRRKENTERWRERNPERHAEHQRVNREAYRIAVYGSPVAIEEMTKDRFRAARALGYRSGLEVSVARQLEESGTPFQYEPFRIGYTRPSEQATYTPDYVLPNGLVIETKGNFVTSDRKKHRIIKAQAPELEIRFVFSNPNAKIGKKSKTSYADWCNQYGFRWARKSIPPEWIAEPTNHASLAAIERMRK